MKRNQYLSAQAVALVMAFFIWQAQINAATASGRKAESGRTSGVKGDEELSRSRTKGQQQTQRARSAMRQRALIYEPPIAVAAAKYKVDPRALWTIAYLETRFRANQKSPKGARGLMQFIPGTAARFNLRNPFNAAESIEAAAQYVAILSNQFNGRLDLVLASYNSGETAVDCYLNGRTVRTSRGRVINGRGIRTGGVPPYKETQAYVRRGMLVYSRVASAGIFSPSQMAAVRELSVPALAATATEVASVNRDLFELGGAPAVLYSQNRVATAAPIADKQNALVEDGFATVFFDVHSGARYLVQSGRIVKPLESEAADKTDSEDNRKAATKSVYIGSRDDR